MPDQVEQCGLQSFLKALLLTSEKAANIARCCRAEDDLFALLVQEKSEDQKNARFIQDFKTLADVLVQETVKHDLLNQFPGIGQRVYGEESNLFTNTLGETICVKILSSELDTAALLCKVLDGNEKVASLLARTIFAEASSDHDLSSVDGDLNLEDIGVWIDPIDSTSEYIHGNREEPNSLGIVKNGLQCACVLIGAYNISNGSPQVGVINQPFANFDETLQSWTGSSYWGTCASTRRWHSISDFVSHSSAIWQPQRTIMVSSSESNALLSRLQERYRVLPVAGAGYKLLTVARGQADVYLLSKGSTYRWDTCGPHAILRALGAEGDQGGVASFRRVMETELEALPRKLDSLQLFYHQGEEGAVDGHVRRWCNSEGILAYNSKEILIEVVTYLKGSYQKYSEMEETAL